MGALPASKEASPLALERASLRCTVSSRSSAITLVSPSCRSASRFITATSSPPVSPPASTASKWSLARTTPSISRPSPPSSDPLRGPRGAGRSAAGWLVQVGAASGSGVEGSESPPSCRCVLVALSTEDESDVKRCTARAPLPSADTPFMGLLNQLSRKEPTDVAEELGIVPSLPLKRVRACSCSRSSRRSPPAWGAGVRCRCAGAGARGGGGVGRCVPAVPVVP
mmetsp:Transcript_47045/g.114630  ORF Transcript_47045/g.114630 Transcript_47045/m.114630 type:complete len:225 (-) Transcript_47045:68-742(-)